MAFGKEFAKTFSQLSNSMKSEDSAQQKMEKKNSSRTTTVEVDKEQEEKYLSSLNKADNDFSGKIINSVTQKNRKAKFINESKAVKAMEMKEADDAYDVIDELREGQAMLLIFEETERAIQEKIVDRIFGACHYGNLCVEQLKGNLILLDPNLKL
ncbi:hypothetical protein AAGG74_18845 [Bacillus mexicanus]|uniref:cell division protein SepF n=1 Tax=Bacillus mexicanus TaxID=2834415 RepID=UPI003D1F731C